MSARFALVAHGSHGDVLPFVKLGRSLRERGHRVLLLSHAPFAARAEAAGLEFHAIDTAEEYARHQSDSRELVGQLRGLDPGRLLGFYTRNRIFEHVAAEFAELSRFCAGGPALVVGRHTSGLSALFAREALGVPAAWVAVTPSQHLGLAATAMTYRQVLHTPLNRARAELGLPPVRDWESWFADVDGLYGLWPRWFDRAGGPAPSALEPVGFVLDDPSESGPVPAEAAALLDGTPAPILVSGSTGGAGRRDLHQPVLAAAARRGLPALVVGGEPDGPRAPGPARHFAHLPYRDVVPRVGAVVHHGGIGTLARALAAGRPQLILAYSFDQPDNGRRLAKRGLGAWLPAARWDERSVDEAFDTMLAAPPVPERLRPDFDVSARTLCARLEALLHDPVGAGASGARISEPVG